MGNCGNRGNHGLVGELPRRLPVLAIVLALCLAAPTASAMDMDDSLIGSIEAN